VREESQNRLIYLFQSKWKRTKKEIFRNLFIDR